MVIRQFEVYLITLDPAKGSEIKKTRPCMVISPDEVNHWLNTIIIVPLTSTVKNYPTRISCTFAGKDGQLALDQMRAVDKTRLVKRLGAFKDKAYREQVLSLAQELFQYRQ